MTITNGTINGDLIIFSTVGTGTITLRNANFDVLIVGGGGSINPGTGAGAGGVVYIENMTFAAGTYNMYVGNISSLSKITSSVNTTPLTYTAAGSTINLQGNAGGNGTSGSGNGNNGGSGSGGVGSSIYLGGLDPHHTNGEIKKGSRALWSYLDYTHYKYEWKRDEEGRNIPYILNINENKWNRINNLHIHCKVLKDFVSK